jgi:hypothetical protein
MEVQITHAQFLWLLHLAWQADERFPWLAQSRFLICIAVVDDNAVVLRLP